MKLLQATAVQCSFAAGFCELVWAVILFAYAVLNADTGAFLPYIVEQSARGKQA